MSYYVAARHRLKDGELSNILHLTVFEDFPGPLSFKSMTTGQQEPYEQMQTSTPRYQIWHEVKEKK